MPLLARTLQTPLFIEKNTLKDEFLASLESPSGKIKYKRFVDSPLRYAGGKSLAVGLIVERIPDAVERIVSPFLGGGSVEIAIANKLNIPVIGYDIFDILINYWRIQLSKPNALYNKLLQFKPTRQGFKEAKEVLLKEITRKHEEDILVRLQKLENTGSEKIEAKAKQILTSSIQRLANSVSSEIFSTTVTIPSDEIKDRIKQCIESKWTA